MNIRKIGVFIFIIQLYFPLFSQTIDELYRAQAYENIIKSYSINDNLSERAVYILGMSYYHLAQDEKAVICFEKAIQFDDANPDYHFFKGTSQLYNDQYPEAIQSYEKCISLDDKNAIYYVGLGDAYFNSNKLEAALTQYKKAILLPECQDRAYIMQAQTLNDLNRLDEALGAYYLAAKEIDPFGESYIDCVFNIGLIEYLYENYTKAEEAFSKVLDLRPLDYQVIAKQIQVFYAQQNFEAANRLKTSMYRAFETGNLPDNQKDMFCFDQFEWEDKRIMAFEKYEEPKDKLYYKHIFYVLNKENRVEFSVQTEHSFAVSMMEKKYILGKNDNTGHTSYVQYAFDEEFHYPDLKASVISILENKPSKKKKRKKNKD